MQPDDALKDAALDRELRRALAVDPSPGFEARVRMRVLDEPVRSWTFNPSWSFAAGVIAFVGVIAIVIQLGNRRANSIATTPLVARTLAPVTGALPDRSSYLASAFRRTVTDPLPPAPESRAEAKHYVRSGFEPDILLDPRETLALRRLIEGVRTGRFDLTPVLHASTPTAMDWPPVEAIQIPEITIEPLAPSGAEGVRQ